MTRQSRGGGHVAVLAATDGSPSEVFALEGGSLRKLTGHNDGWLAGLRLGNTEEISFPSKDGTQIHGLLVKPPSYEPGVKYPTLFRIHGGPHGQDEHAFSFERQLFAARGYVVINVNYRGSSGRGEKYAQALFRDWGSKDVADIQAGADYAVRSGIADPARFGIGGWSYGGILTDFVIAP